VKIPDLLIAATAEAASVRVLHYDLIASITAQDAVWVVKQGSVS
jgi:predicted nucleic acid-binding protein